MPNNTRNTCKLCNQPIPPESKGKIYCSVKCKVIDSRVRTQVICDGCGTSFEKLPYLVRKTNYCSTNCYRTSTRLKQQKVCIKCGTKFAIKNYLVKQGYGQYCSRKCQHKDYPIKIKLRCKECDAIIIKPPSVAIRTIYCSKKCRDLAMSDIVSRQCHHCEKMFDIPTWETNKGKGKFCSRTCFILFKGESSLEEKVRKYLELHRISFIQEKKFGRYHADFFLEDRNLVIECDGEYWHLSKESQARDVRKDRFLNNLGYQVARLSGRQINENLTDHIQKVL
jgi:very-short-patch-repair endonuclease